MKTLKKSQGKQMKVLSNNEMTNIKGGGGDARTQTVEKK